MTFDAVLQHLPAILTAGAGSGIGLFLLKMIEERHRSSMQRDEYEFKQAERYAQALSKSKDELLEWMRVDAKKREVSIAKLSEQVRIEEAKNAALQAHLEALKKERREDEARFEERLASLEAENRALGAAVMKMHRATGRRVTNMTDILRKIEDIPTGEGRGPTNW